MMNPCCCIPMQIGLYFFGAFDIISALLGIGTYSVILGLLDNYKETGLSADEKKNLRILLIIHLAIFSFGLLFAIFLIICAMKKNAKGCLIWFGITLTMLITHFCLFIVQIVVYGFFGFQLKEAGSSFLSYTLIYTIYELVVVYCFAYEIEHPVVVRPYVSAANYSQHTNQENAKGKSGEGSTQGTQPVETATAT